MKNSECRKAWSRALQNANIPWSKRAICRLRRLRIAVCLGGRGTAAAGMNHASGGVMINMFSRFARATSGWFAHPVAFALAILFVAVWASLGPVFHFSDTWQLVINTSTTILTFLMVFLLQNAQNRDARAMQLKLDELLRVAADARNEMIDLEH